MREGEFLSERHRRRDRDRSEFARTGFRIRKITRSRCTNAAHSCPISRVFHNRQFWVHFITPLHRSAHRLPRDFQDCLFQPLTHPSDELNQYDSTKG